ncbi:putative late blight resistance protein homolog R1B-16 [Coffea arabica]|uniref:Late blight resistance protein homolog R1B-16 n=1 Tax=Coffea arabica TaxID=13443 RepID=A0A6P6V0E9_COFAR|nr:putative late blight resistance protein homolog R1B-16 [Coffea arabica]
MPNEDLELLLYQNLRRNRYLVFMDDMWNIEAWNELQNPFPDDRNGSRILITSRLHHVVSQFTEEGSLLNLRPLSEKESWELLKRKVFTKEGYPEALVEVGKEIARNCQGLPLSVVAISGLLKTTNMICDMWKAISESLNSLIVNDPQTRCLDILELSYNHLPDYLKACFLYFGAFQGNKEIPVQKLMWLWMAEGFIQDNDLAKDYLKDLIERSLIIFAKRRSNRGVNVKCMTRDDEPYASFHDILDFEDFDPSNSVKHEEHRLCFCVSRKLFFMSMPSGPNLRQHGNAFVDGIQLLLLLRYLAVAGYMDSVPPTLADLQNLETFIVKGFKGKVLLPDTFWSMTRLRHVHIDSHASFTFQNEKVGSSSQLSNLVSFSTPYLSCGEHTEEIIRRVPNLKKLSCVITKSGDYSQNSSEFPRLEDLTQLENLEVLKLVSIVFEDTTWEMSDDEFPELKFLKLDNLNIAEWIASEDHMPKLEQLVLQKCEKLNDVPIDFVEISTLQMIEVQRCGDSVEKSVMKIKVEDKLRFGTDDLKVLIIH